MKNAYKKIGSWIAIFAMLLTSFMPLISHAIESQNNLDNQERICTSQGIKFVSTQNDSSDKNHTSIKMIQFVQKCFNHETCLKPFYVFSTTDLFSNIYLN